MSPNRHYPLHQRFWLKSIKHSDFTCPLDSTFWAMCLVAFFLLLRKSNLVPDSYAAFNVNKQLCRYDFEFFAQEVRVTLRWTKTNQFGKHEQFSLPRIPGSSICPWTALMHMQNLLPGGEICFRRPDGKSWIYSSFSAG